MEALIEAEVETEFDPVDERNDPRSVVSSPSPSFPAKIDVVNGADEPPSSEGGIGETVGTVESRCVDPALDGTPETPETPESVETPFPEFVETVETVEAIEPIGISGGCCPAGIADPIETPCCVVTVETVETADPVVPGLVLIPAGMFWKSAGGGMGRMEGESRVRSVSNLDAKKMDWGTRTGDTESVRTEE